MGTRQTVVTCPCCESRLEVDALSGKVVTWQRKTELDETGKPIVREEDWDEASARVQGRLASATDRFDAGLAREQNREKDLDDLFKKASEKALKPDEDES